MALLLLFFIAAIVISFMCSILEAVLLSITPYYVGLKEMEAASFAPELSEFKADVDRPLAAILSLNTIANTMGAVGVGSQAAIVFGSTPLQIFGVSFISWEAVIAGTMTLCILVFSEVIPKTIGANNWEKLTPAAVRILSVLMVVLAPFVWLSQFITYRLKRKSDDPVLTLADYRALTDLSRQHGVLEASEQHLIKNLLKFNRIEAEDIMTPSKGMVTGASDMTIRQFYQQHAALPYSRIPVLNEGGITFSGYVHKDQILAHVVNQRDELTLAEISRELLSVPHSMALPDLLEYFVQHRESIALVEGKDGTVQGMVTIKDIIETVLELEILEIDDDHEDWRVRAREFWQQRAEQLGLLHDEAEDRDVGTDKGEIVGKIEPAPEKKG